MMKETIDLFGKILTNILTALYEPFGFSLLLSFLAMFFYLYAYEPIHAGKGWKNAIVTWYQKFKESVFFRRLFFLAFVTSLILFRTLLNRQLWIGNLSSIHLAFRHLIDFLAVQHQVGCKSVWLIKTDTDSAGNAVALMVPNYQVDGKTGTWLPYDSEVVEGVCFFMMRNEQRRDDVSPIVVDSKGVFVTEAPNGFENVRATISEYVRRAEKKQQDMTEHEKCLTNGTYERARESGTEQNYNMIDGCVNNNPKKPRVIGNRVSVLDRLHIKLEERKQKEQGQQQQQERTLKN